MYLMKLTVSKDAAIQRNDLESRITQLIPGYYELNGHRVTTDAIRCALSYRLQAFQKFEYNNAVCKAIAASPKQTKRGELHIEIHVQERNTEGVEYTSNVCTITRNPTDGLEWAAGEDYEKYAFLVEYLDIESLQDFGTSTSFEADIRRTFQNLTDQRLLKFWNGGVYVALTQEAHDEVKRAASVFADLPAGHVLLRVIILDNTDANKAAVAAELGESVFAKAFEQLTQRAEKPGANVERLETEYMELMAKLAEIETWLGHVVSCTDERETFEIALSAIS